MVEKFVQKLYSDAGPSDLSSFYTTDSVACSIAWLKEEVAARVAKGGPKLVEVMSCAPVIAGWIKKSK